MIKGSRTYLATRACNSTGAPESTAAGTTSPGSLPSITRFGMGENVLCNASFSMLFKHCSALDIRSPMINRCSEVRLVIYHSLRRIFSSYHSWISRRRSWTRRGIGLGRWLDRAVFICVITGRVARFPYLYWRNALSGGSGKPEKHASMLSP